MGPFSRVLLLLVGMNYPLPSVLSVLLPFIGQDCLRDSAPQGSTSVEHFPLEHLVPLNFTPLKKNGEHSLLSTRTKVGLLFSSV